ncbi:hypothetical protein NLI96_g12668 [Meripilus lineatus]|uniref:Protein kinase domain-containing protein n=1 Tax=Meripilus lineatus TaxID=2056292 RepID=A0AAD5YC66_9APHY|nr:hypothetical protein NLI96_g12668 [Physisporinus lineatus]
MLLKDIWREMTRSERGIEGIFTNLLFNPICFFEVASALNAWVDKSSDAQDKAIEKRQRCLDQNRVERVSAIENGDVQSLVEMMVAYGLDSKAPDLGHVPRHVLDWLLQWAKTKDDSDLAAFQACDTQHIMDILDEILIRVGSGDYQVEEGTASRLRYVMVKLSKARGVFPKAFLPSNVELLDPNCKDSGAFGDIYQGAIDGKLVALKCMRLTRSDIEDEDKFSALKKESHMSSMLHQTACGLSYLHTEGVIHADLRAVNVLVDDFGNAQLADFGLSAIEAGGTSNRWFRAMN